MELSEQVLYVEAHISWVKHSASHPNTIEWEKILSSLRRLQAIEEATGEFVSVPLSEKAKRKGFHAFIKAMGSEMPRNDDGTYNGSFSHAILVAHYAMLAAAKEQK